MRHLYKMERFDKVNYDPTVEVTICPDIDEEHGWFKPVNVKCPSCGNDIVVYVDCPLVEVGSVDEEVETPVKRKRLESVCDIGQSWEEVCPRAPMKPALKRLDTMAPIDVDAWAEFFQGSTGSGVHLDKDVGSGDGGGMEVCHE